MSVDILDVKTKNDVKKITRNSLIYIFSDLLTRIISFLLIPIYTAKLAPFEYGILGTMTSLISILGVLGTLGFPGIVALIYHHAQSKDDREQELWTIFLLNVIVSVIFASVALIFGKGLFEHFFRNIPFYPYGLLAITIACSSGWIQIPIMSFRAAEKPLPFAIISLIGFVLTTSIILSLVLCFNLGVRGVFWGTFLGNGILALFSPIIMKSYGRIRFKPILITKFTVLSLPLIPHSLFTWVYGLSDKFILQRFVPLKEVGLYTLAYQFGIGLSILGGAINNAWAPFVLKAQKEDKPEERFAILSKYLAIIFMAMTLGTLFLGTDVIKYILDNRYEPAVRLIPWIVLGYGLVLLYFIPMNFVYSTGKTHFMFLVSGSAAVVNLIGNLLIIPTMGSYGAALMTFITFCISLAASTILMILLCPQNLPWLKFAKILAFAIICAIIGIKISMHNLYLDIALHFAIILSYPFVLCMAGVITKTEITDTISLFYRRLLRLIHFHT